MSELGFSSTAEEATRGISLEGKTILITGVNSGIGFESMRVLALRGAQIIGLARTVEKAEEALLKANAQGHALACDLSEPKSAQRCVEEVKALGITLDALLFNAGIMALPERKQKYGIELQFLTNHMGHFILGTGLLGQLAEDARVVVLSSGAHFQADKTLGIDFDDLAGDNYQPWKQYGQSKLANILFVRALTQRFQAEGSQRIANALHPGVIRTNLTRHMGNAIFDSIDPAILKNVEQGAATSCWAVAHPDAGKLQGEYLSDCQVAKGSPFAKDDAMAEELWQKSMDLLTVLL